MERGWEAAWRACVQAVSALLQRLRELPDWGLLLALLLAALLGALLLGRVLTALRFLRARTFRSLGQHGERVAEELLRQHGYTIVDRQRAGRYRVRIDGKPCDVDLRADFLVEHKGRVLVAEVKNGPVVNNPLHVKTRRQLLEYEVGFAVDGVVLVDVPGKAVRVVEFPVR